MGIIKMLICMDVCCLGSLFDTHLQEGATEDDFGRRKGFCVVKIGSGDGKESFRVYKDQRDRFR